MSISLFSFGKRPPLYRIYRTGVKTTQTMGAVGPEMWFAIRNLNVPEGTCPYTLAAACAIAVNFESLGTHQKALEEFPYGAGFESWECSTNYLGTWSRVDNVLTNRSDSLGHRGKFPLLELRAVNLKARKTNVSVGHHDSVGSGGFPSSRFNGSAPLLIGHTGVITTCSDHPMPGSLRNIICFGNHAEHGARHSPGMNREYPHHIEVVLANLIAELKSNLPAVAVTGETSDHIVTRVAP